MFSNQVKKGVWATLTVMLMLTLATLACGQSTTEGLAEAPTRSQTQSWLNQQLPPLLQQPPQPLPNQLQGPLKRHNLRQPSHRQPPPIHSRRRLLPRFSSIAHHRLATLTRVRCITAQVLVLAAVARNVLLSLLHPPPPQPTHPCHCRPQQPSHPHLAQHRQVHQPIPPRRSCLRTCPRRRVRPAA